MTIPTPVTLLDGVLAAVLGTAGTALDTETLVSNWAVQVIPSATLTSGSVVFEGSLDNTNWTRVGQVDVTPGGRLLLLATAPCRYLRAVPEAIEGPVLTASLTVKVNI
jgi:hypothetical protein